MRLLGLLIAANPIGSLHLPAFGLADTTGVHMPFNTNRRRFMRRREVDARIKSPHTHFSIEELHRNNCLNT